MLQVSYSFHTIKEIVEIAQLLCWAVYKLYIQAANFLWSFHLTGNMSTQL